MMAKIDPQKTPPILEAFFKSVQFKWSSTLSFARLSCLACDALVATLTAHRHLLTALATARIQNITPAYGRHTLAEAVLVTALTYGGLKCPFHLAKVFSRLKSECKDR